MEQQKPSVGRIVHYVQRVDELRNRELTHTTECRAAIITAINGNPEKLGRCSVDLAVFAPMHHSSLGGVYYQNAADQIGNTWHWPERA